MTQSAARVQNSFHGLALERFCMDIRSKPEQNPTLRNDVLVGFSRTPKSLPPKHFYDEVGSRLFEQICDTPEYYPTRTEQALLARVADAIVGKTKPTCIVELGSGSSRKISTLLGA